MLREARKSATTRATVVLPTPPFSPCVRIRRGFSTCVFFSVVAVAVLISIKAPRFVKKDEHSPDARRHCRSPAPDKCAATASPKCEIPTSPASRRCSTLRHAESRWLAKEFSKKGEPVDLDLDDHFSQLLARQKEFNALKPHEQLFQAPLVEQLRGPVHPGLRHLQQIHILDSESVIRNRIQFIVRMEKA